ncbi:F-box domain-containing protein [Apodospora peruviana]|uniref:F-box domain-containing protein n=1 Tax=Apodospora peruviana TaxID=516989 RepID=A0AAE0I472_9PEZI|nr:F-box domain-containing protein [Apodospora peruviana]
MAHLYPPPPRYHIAHRSTPIRHNSNAPLDTSLQPILTRSAAMAHADATEPALTFMRLPREVQNDIFSHCQQNDLICLSLVSRYFRELAAAQLYRNFHIVFPDEDDPSYETPIDGLAGGLDTFVTSPYDYAKHLRDLSLDTHSAGDKAEIAYKPYLYNVSCGKFMNTLLLLTLRKATSLESFRWNIRVELSRPVYKALHDINTLTNVHIRLQSGPSLYETPPPLPFSYQSGTSPASLHMSGGGVYTPAPPPVFANLPPPPSVFYVPTTSAPPPPLPKPIARVKAIKKSPLTKEPPTLSGFKKLKTLAVLDIDTLDVVTELKTCIQNSAGTLSKVKLSFSDALGLLARKPPPDIDPDDSDQDDEFQAIPAPPPGQGYHDDVSGPAKAYRAQEEKKSQESVLGRIFDVEPPVGKKTQKKTRDKEKGPKAKDESPNPGRDFINAIKAVSAKLMKEVHDVDDISASQQEILDTIESAARKYVASEEAKTSSGKEDDKAEGSTSSAPTPASSASEDKPETKPADETAASDDLPGGLFDQPSNSKSKETQKDANPDDIDIEEPEEQLVIEPQDPPIKDVATSESIPAPTPEPSSKEASVANSSSSVSSSVGKAVANLAAQKLNLKALTEKLDKFESQAQLTARENDEPEGVFIEELQGLGRDIKDVQKEMSAVQAEIADLERQLSGKSSTTAAETSSRQLDYLRTTRGIALQSLAIYLIPVKTSVLSRAIDLRVLRRITLLNVGPQAPIWAHLQKENKESPLPLRKIFTDNVSKVFLDFVAQLEELHELFMMERDNKYKPESFAPKTNVSMDQIRRTVLKKHMPTLKRLMIKNMSDTTWDFNEKAIMLMCKRGRNLEELACSMGIRAIHIFMQHLSGLVSLRALHIVRLRNDDTCVWVMRETKKFLIDNVSHHPHLKLEWVSVDDEDRVERLIRPSASVTKSKDKKSKKSKGKQKASSAGPGGGGGGNNDMFPLLPPPDSWENSGHSSDSDEDDEDLHEMKIETLENVHFYDVWGVRIFKKESVYGRL